MSLRPRHLLLFDGDCCFCARWAARVTAVDLSAQVETLDFRRSDTASIDPRLTPARCEMKVQLLERDGRLSEGFGVLQRLSLLLPALWPAAPFVHLPGARRVGEPLYELAARLRFRLSGRP